MSEFAARISRVRMKAGGADVRIMVNHAPNAEGENWAGELVRNARTAAEWASAENPIAGYAVIAMFSDGSSSVGYRYDGDLCSVPRVLFPAWVEELLRRDMITYPEAVDVVNRANGFDD